MNIGQAASLSQLPPKTIRYYEEIELINPARAENGYRDYSDGDVHRLRFLQRARGLGFSITECRLLLSLYEDKDRASHDVKAMALDKISEIDRKINELNSLKHTLSTLAEHCNGDNKPDCPIIEDLARGSQEPRGGP
ncbi:MAG: Cu(I)-responsive transcriptional regulator [Pseudomonadota bacterium]